jgi:hypothetical protein
VDILYFATGPGPKARAALDYLQRRFPDAQVTIAACPDLMPLLSPAEQSGVIFQAAGGQSRRQFLQHAWRTRYDVVAVLFGGDAHYESMKLAALALRPRAFILCINESCDAFEWRLSNWRLIAQHARWRLSSGRRDMRTALARAVYLSVGEALGLGLLVVRVLTLIVRRRGQ